MHVDIRLAEEADVLWMAPRLREADRQELQAATGESPLVALTKGFEASTPPHVGTLDDEPFVMYGVVPHLPHGGVIWMLGTPTIEQASTGFLRRTRKEVERLGGDYPRLFNLADARNTVHLRWIKWAGFRFVRKHQNIGKEQRPFVEFERINPNYV